MNPLTVDISDFYGQPIYGQQSTDLIVDKRKTLNTHKKLENKFEEVKPNKNANTTYTPPTGKRSRGRPRKNKGGMSEKSGGAISIGDNTAGALAFNEDQLKNELSGLKKGGALGPLAATIIPQLIQMAPEIIKSLKSLKHGGAIKVGGASAMFVEGVKPDDYDDIIEWMEKVKRQKKNLIREGGAIKVGSGRVGTFFKNTWDKMKKWYNNGGKETLKPFTDILLQAASNKANQLIDKGVKYVGDKTNSDTLKQMTDIAANMGRDVVENYTGKTRNDTDPNTAATGSGYDIANVDNTVKPKKERLPRGKKTARIMPSLEQNQNKITERTVRRVY